MKQNTVRIQNNGAKGRRLPQAKSRSCKAVAQIPEHGIENGWYSSNADITATIQEYRRDAIVAGCEIEPSQLEKFAASAKVLGLSMGQLLNLAILEKCQCGGAETQQADKQRFQQWDDLKLIVRESHALQRLMFDAFIPKLRVGETCYSEDQECGIMDIVQGIQRRLNASVDSMDPRTIKAVHGATVGAAS
jgi:hypothetical protein